MKLTIAKGASLPIKIALVIVGSAILTLSAKISVPFYPVPMTMQTFALLLIALMLPPYLAVSTVLLYLVEGAVGMPVFEGTPEKGIGLGYMMGPTGGYLVGFVLCVGFVSFCKEKFSSMISHALISAVGVGLLFGAGLLWLGTLIGWDKPLLTFGLYPFILGDCLKLILAVLTAHGLARLSTPKANPPEA